MRVFPCSAYFLKLVTFLMRYFALATDFDDTLAHDGEVPNAAVEALERLKASGRKLLMVTGRELRELLPLLNHPKLFDRIVAENGAVLFRPETGDTIMLGTPPPQNFLEALRNCGIPMSEGKVIVATREPHHIAVLETIRQLGLESQVIFNKGAVMILPSGINKATGLKAALKEFGISRHNVAGIGDAENDHAFLERCGLAVAVANALPALKEKVHLVTRGERGAGVIELVERLLSEDTGPAMPHQRETQPADQAASVRT